jgi:hypothetical protein
MKNALSQNKSTIVLHDINAFQIKIDEQTHRIQISQLADDTTPKMIYLLL